MNKLKERLKANCTREKEEKYRACDHAPGAMSSGSVSSDTHTHTTSVPIGARSLPHAAGLREKGESIKNIKRRRKNVVESVRMQMFVARPSPASLALTIGMCQVRLTAPVSLSLPLLLLTND